MNSRRPDSVPSSKQATRQRKTTLRPSGLRPNPTLLRYRAPSPLSRTESGRPCFALGCQTPRRCPASARRLLRGLASGVCSFLVLVVWWSAAVQPGAAGDPKPSASGRHALLRAGVLFIVEVVPRNFGRLSLAVTRRLRACFDARRSGSVPVSKRPRAGHTDRFTVTPCARPCRCAARRPRTSRRP